MAMCNDLLYMVDYESTYTYGLIMGSTMLNNNFLLPPQSNVNYVQVQDPGLDTD